MGPDRLAQEVKIPRSEAVAFIDAYFDHFAGVRRYIEETIEGARRNGHVTTLLGRRRYLPEIGSSDARVHRFAENMAVNTPIQGSAADLIKKAMIEIHRRLGEEGRGARMILQVHDELLFEVPRGEIDDVRELVRGCMEGSMELRVPLVVDVKVGENWYEAH
jgi:DNA polymerase-1